jgi:hypothetical protein
MRNYGNPAPNPDAVEEFRVETNAFAAQYGQFSGAVVSVITKSGTTKFHGALFEFNRNTDFNAYPWNPSNNPLYRETSRPLTIATTLAEPLAAPSRTTRPSSSSAMPVCARCKEHRSQAAVVPTAAERVGDFTADTTLTSLIYMPGTNKTVLANGTNAGPGCQTISSATAGYCIPLAFWTQPLQICERKQQNRCFHSVAHRRPGHKNWRRHYLRPRTSLRQTQTNTWQSMTRTSAARTMWE